jgi:hypothetical protein
MKKFIYNLFNLNKKQELNKQEEELPHYQWIVHHCRSTDRVFFGPFKNIKELDDFFKDPKNERVQHSIELLISPTCPKDQYWYNPLDQLSTNYPALYYSEDKFITPIFVKKD